MKTDRRLQDAVVIAFLVVMALLWVTGAWSAEIVDSDKLADAIYRAENSIEHPYGIMRDYCHKGEEKQCRKGCIQTIEKWKMKLDYKSSEEFIRKFSEIYAPSKSHPLNKNWPKNVLYFYNNS